MACAAAQSGLEPLLEEIHLFHKTAPSVPRLQRQPVHVNIRADVLCRLSAPIDRPESYSQLLALIGVIALVLEIVLIGCAFFHCVEAGQLYMRSVSIASERVSWRADSVVLHMLMHLLFITGRGRR